MQACLIYGPSFQTVSKGALLSPPATPGYQLQPGPDDRWLWPVCKVSRVFEHVKGPKSPWNLEKQRLNGIDKSPPPTHTQTHREREKILQKIHIQTKISDFLWVWGYDCKLKKVSCLMRTIHLPSFVILGKTKPPFLTKGAATEPFHHARFWNFAHVYWIINVMCLSGFIQFQAC